MKLQNNNSFGVAAINTLESSILNTEYFPHGSEVLFPRFCVSRANILLCVNKSRYTTQCAKYKTFKNTRPACKFCVVDRKSRAV